MNRILVTGGAGFIGSHTVDELLRRGYQVRVLDALQERVHPRGWPDYLPPAVERMVGDVRDADAMRRALDGIDGVVHLAAYQDYMPDFSTYFAVNTVGTALLFELIVEAGLPVRKIVLASSQSVYGEGRYECGACEVVYPDPRSQEQLAAGRWEVCCPECGAQTEPLPLTERDELHPHTAYGISKQDLEATALRLGRRYGIPVANMRYSIVQGTRNSFYNAYSGVARIFTLRLLHDQPPVIYEDGQQRRDYVHVADVARANVLALEDDRADFRCFNVAGQGSTTVREVADMLARICDKTRTEAELPGEYRLGDTRHTVSSWEAIGELGWRPQTGPEVFLRDYVDWVRQQPNLADFYAHSQSRMKAAGVIQRAGSQP
ncbi:MAG: NAD-dependent epimerase/dehydratase family protein [Candidatus Latescibacteria bacterium]|nr:NAD-dependent epimerase/dehydratase family protein [Candidatus Latescibacterota bacterium]